MCGIRHRSRFATHDACQRHRTIAIGNHQVIGLQRDFRVIQQSQFFARLRKTHLNIALQQVQIKRMQRLPLLQQNIIGDVHQRADTADTAAFQTAYHPVRCGGLCIHTFNHAAIISRTGIAGCHCHRFAQGACNSRWLDSGHLHRRTGHGDHISCNADNTQAIRTVGRQFQRVGMIIQIQKLANILTHRCIGRQLQNAIGFSSDAQFFGRAHHAERLHTAHFGLLDIKSWQLCPHQRTRCFQTGTRVGRTTDNLQHFAANIHFADLQTVCIRVLDRFQDFSDDNALKSRSNRRQLFHFQTGHGQCVTKLRGIQRRVDHGT